MAVTLQLFNRNFASLFQRFVFFLANFSLSVFHTSYKTGLTTRGYSDICTLFSFAFLLRLLDGIMEDELKLLINSEGGDDEMSRRFPAVRH